MTQPDRARARRLAQESLAKGDAVGWFDTLYVAAEGDASRIPWADLRVNPTSPPGPARAALAGNGQRALVVGCGWATTPRSLARHGFRVTAFDVSASAIEWCRRRFPASPVDYQAGRPA